MSAIQWSTVEDAIWSWIVAGSGLAGDHVTWAQQTSPRPAGEFISLRLTMLDRKGSDFFERTDNLVVVPSQTIAAVSTIANTLTVPAHGLVTGQGPLVLGGAPPAPLALATNYWAVVVDANTIKVAATFPNAIATVPVTIALTTTGTLPTIAGPLSVLPGAEVLQKLRGPRRAMLTLQCFAGAPTGGGATGATSPAAVLHDAISSYALESRTAALVAAGVGVGTIEHIHSIDGIVNTTRFEPRAIGTVFLHFASEIVETVTYVQTVNASGLTSVTITTP